MSAHMLCGYIHCFTEYPLLALSLYICTHCVVHVLNRTGHYLIVQRSHPDSPIVNLSIAICYLRIAMHRRLTERHRMVMQTMVYLFKYVEQDASSAAALYNAGRAFHQLGTALKEIIGLLIYSE